MAPLVVRHRFETLRLSAFVRVLIAHGVAPAVARRFETGLLDGWADAAAHGLTVPVDPEIDVACWWTTFQFWRRATGE